MSNLAEKLETLQNTDRIDHPAEINIEGFEQLIVLFATDIRFQNLTLTYLANDSVGISSGEVNLIFLPAQLWTDENFAKNNNSLTTDDQTMIICCGSEGDFASISEAFNQANIHQIVFPSTLRTLHFQIRGFIRSRLYHTEASEQLKYADTTLQNIKHVLSISRELNGIRDVNKLLSLILEKARQVTHADAGSVYVVDQPVNGKEGSIIFKVCQNESIELNLAEFTMPISNKSIVGNSVIHAKTINIPDLYKLDKDPTRNSYQVSHDSSWDRRNNYETHSMASIPIYDISHAVIGVIQLINCKTGSEPLKTSQDFQDRVIAFDEIAVEYGEVVAHQAGIALENALLTEEKEALFRGFVDASVKAIEQRDPTTSGHSHRVARLTLKLAEMVHKCPTGPYKNINFNENQFREIEYASLLHDFGKISVREQVLLKSKKLYESQMAQLTERFELIRSKYEIEYLQEYINYLNAPHMYPPEVGPDNFRHKCDAKHHELSQFYDFIIKANEPTVLEQGGFEKLKDIANFTYRDSQKRELPYLRPEELRALSVSRGSLTSDEFSEIQSHVTHTYEFLRKIPWGRNLANVPHIAAKHHEKLDGTGYPTAANADEIPVQSRMMTIADIFDALTAADRPYKKSVPLEKALSIIEMEVKAGKCDSELFRIFVEAECFRAVQY